MKLTIKNVVFKNYNGQDNLYFDVVEDIFKMMKENSPIYQNEKIIDGNTLWVKIYDGGIATFGYTMEHDPLHGNSRYTWSSNASCINREFNLIGTPYELARYGAGIRVFGSSSCYWAGELTKALALEIGEQNKSKLFWGIEKYKNDIDTVR